MLYTLFVVIVVVDVKSVQKLPFGMRKSQGLLSTDEVDKGSSSNQFELGGHLKANTLKRMLVAGRLVLAVGLGVGAVTYGVLWVKDTYRHGKETELEGELDSLGFNGSNYDVDVDLEHNLVRVDCDKAHPNSPVLSLGMIAAKSGGIVAWAPSSTRLDADGQLIESDSGAVFPLTSEQGVDDFLRSSQVIGWCEKLQ